jgi:hypothetical protein
VSNVQPHHHMSTSVHNKHAKLKEELQNKGRLSHYAE